MYIFLWVENLTKRENRENRNESSFEEVTIINQILHKLDHRKVLELKPYKENEGIDLEEYLSQFEE